MTLPEPAVSVRGVQLRFGGLKALDEVSFDVHRGSLTALIGPNGAGKTSMFNCISGIYKPTLGTILLEGEDTAGVPQFQVARRGLARTFQTPSLFGGLSVRENLALGQYQYGRSGMIAGMLRLPSLVAEEVIQRERVEEVLELLEISHLRNVAVADLSYGIKKRVELGRALSQSPRVLLLDEPMAGMTIEEKEDMSAFILAARDEMEMSILLVEHDMGVVMDIAEHVVVLDFGRLIGDGTPDQVRAIPAVLTAYLGTGHA